MSDMSWSDGFGRLGKNAMGFFADYNRNNPEKGPDHVKVALLDQGLSQEMLTVQNELIDPVTKQYRDPEIVLPTLKAKMDEYLTREVIPKNLTPEELQEYQLKAATQYTQLLATHGQPVKAAINAKKQGEGTLAAGGYAKDLNDPNGLEKADALLDQLSGKKAETTRVMNIDEKSGNPTFSLQETGRTVYDNPVWSESSLKIAKESMRNMRGAEYFKRDFELNPTGALGKLKAKEYRGLGLNEETETLLASAYEEKMKTIQQDNANLRLDEDNLIFSDFDKIRANGVKTIKDFAKDTSLYKSLLKVQSDALRNNYMTGNLAKVGKVTQATLDKTQGTLDKVTSLLAAVNEELKDPKDPSTQQERIAEALAEYRKRKAGLFMGLTPAGPGWNKAIEDFIAPYQNEARFADVKDRIAEAIRQDNEKELKDLQDTYLAPLVADKKIWEEKLGDNSSLATMAYNEAVKQDAQSRTASGSGNAKGNDPLMLKTRFNMILYNLLDQKGLDKKGLEFVPNWNDIMADNGTKIYKELIVHGSANDRGLGTSADENFVDAVVNKKALLAYDSMPKVKQQSVAKALNGIANGFYQLAPKEALEFKGKDGKPVTASEVIPAKDNDGNFGLVVQLLGKDGKVQGQKVYIPVEIPRDKDAFGGNRNLWSWVEADPSTWDAKQGASPLKMADDIVRGHPYLEHKIITR